MNQIGFTNENKGSRGGNFKLVSTKKKKRLRNGGGKKGLERKMGGERRSKRGQANQPCAPTKTDLTAPETDLHGMVVGGRVQW